MLRFALLILCIYGFWLAPHFIFASVVISEVLFDPVGTDTGLEKIELYNPDAAAIDLSSWELYPDGIGYFVFPSGFSVAAKSFALIHLRASGANDAVNLYHPSPVENMGNTSGSVALFSSHSHKAETLVDFVEWSGKGASSTWESAAAERGLWQRAAPVNTGALAEGNSIGLAADGARGSASAWRIYATPTIGRANAGIVVTPPPPAAATPPPPKASQGLAPPSLRVEGGGDLTVLAGAVIPFRGQVFVSSGELIENARMLWNFGDGSFRDGKAVTHIYYFPGTYIVSLSGSSGEYAGSDYLSVRVLAPELRITEVKPGADGFVELSNPTAERLDLGGVNLADAAGAIFRIVPGTLIEKGTAIVFPNAITKLEPLPRLTLRDAREKVLDQVEYTGVLKLEESLERLGKNFEPTNPPTPGSYTGFVPTASGAETLSPSGTPSRSPLASGSSEVRSNISPAPPASVTGYEPSRTAGTSSRAVASAVKPSVTLRTFFAASVLLSLIAAAGFVMAKRRLP